MIAVHLEKRRVEVRNLRRPPRTAGLAVMRLLCGGICNTDLELQRGYFGFSGTPGHEFVGEVVEADNPNLLGRRVVGEINLACKKCEWCRRGLGRHCPSRTVLGIAGHPGAIRAGAESSSVGPDQCHRHDFRGDAPGPGTPCICACGRARRSESAADVTKF